LVPKWDSIDKRAKKRKNEEGARVMDLKCVHAKNETTYMSLCQWTIFPFVEYQVQVGNDKKSRKKVIQFASIFMLFSKGKPMTNYEDFRHFYDFLKFKNNLKKH
jgi:hypothetical protein